MDEIVFRLGPGKTIRALVQNETSEPIPGVRVVLEGNGDIGRTYEFSTQTGADGRFVWDSAPDEPMQFYFGKEGYAQLRNKVLKPDEENVVTLQKPREIDGYVLDADSGQPITKFRAGSGRWFGTDNLNVDYPGMTDYSDPNGHFTVSLSEAEQDGIKVAAEEHAELAQRVPQSQQSGTIRMEFRLKLSPALRGIVTTPDGTPVAGAQVALLKGEFPMTHISLRGGGLYSSGGGGQVVTADASGQFTLDSVPETGGKAIATGEAGFGVAPVEQVRSTGVLILQPYGQIEGVLKIAGIGAAGKELFFNLNNIGVSTDFNDFKTETDDQGQFKFNKVPPGEGQIVRLIKTSDHSWLHSHNTTVTVQPGQTTYVTLGDSGAIIRGLARLSGVPTDGEPLRISGSLNSKLPTPPSFNSPAESQAFFASAEWKARTKASKYFGVAVANDGSFLVDSVPPGTYNLHLSASKAGSQPFGGAVVASQTLVVTVPDDLSPFAPIDVGEIVLSPAQGK
jgi:hypothetical protein